jgi:hypothetical protein
MAPACTRGPRFHPALATLRFASLAQQGQISGGRCRRARAVALLTTHCTRSPSPTCAPAGRARACAA